MNRAVAAEFLGTLLLVAAVVGSGIMAERLAGGNAALALLANTLATVAALYVLIRIFGPVSGAHFNPVVTGVMVVRKALPAPAGIRYAAAQFTGGAAGAGLANLMFALPPISFSGTPRSSPALWLSEIVATFALLLAILGVDRKHAPTAVAAMIGAAYWFTASTSFANPAVTVARSLSNTFSGIAPASVPAFVAMQAIGAALATIAASYLFPTPYRSEPDVA